MRTGKSSRGARESSPREQANISSLPRFSPALEGVLRLWRKATFPAPEGRFAHSAETAAAGSKWASDRFVFNCLEISPGDQSRSALESAARATSRAAALRTLLPQSASLIAPRYQASGPGVSMPSTLFSTWFSSLMLKGLNRVAWAPNRAAARRKGASRWAVMATTTRPGWCLRI